MRNISPSTQVPKIFGIFEKNSSTNSSRRQNIFWSSPVQTSGDQRNLGTDPRPPDLRQQLGRSRTWNNRSAWSWTKHSFRPLFQDTIHFKILQQSIEEKELELAGHCRRRYDFERRQSGWSSSMLFRLWRRTNCPWRTLGIPSLQ